MDLGLKGLRAIVTGGSKGIGDVPQISSLRRGASVAICARNADEVIAAVKSLKAKGVDAFGAAIDVADKAALKKFIADSAAALGGVDILVANVSALAAQDTEEAWHKAFEVDIMHTVHTVNAALPFLYRSILRSSSFPQCPEREIDFAGPAYGAFKAAFVHYAQNSRMNTRPK